MLVGYVSIIILFEKEKEISYGFTRALAFDDVYAMRAPGRARFSFAFPRKTSETPELMIERRRATTTTENVLDGPHNNMSVVRMLTRRDGYEKANLTHPP